MKSFVMAVVKSIATLITMIEKRNNVFENNDAMKRVLSVTLPVTSFISFLVSPVIK